MLNTVFSPHAPLSISHATLISTFLISTSAPEGEGTSDALWALKATAVEVFKVVQGAPESVLRFTSPNSMEVVAWW